MNAGDLPAALDLPARARVDQRVPKKLLLEQATTTFDRRCITEGIKEVWWVAALKPTTIGVPLFHDEVREYLEIAVLSASLRAGAKSVRRARLLHRAVPYPLLLVAEQEDCLSLSLAHKRWSQNEAGATVLDGEVISAEIASGESGGPVQGFQAALALTRQPRAHLFALYQGWMDTSAALRVARETGAFALPASPVDAIARQDALRECARLDAEIARLRAAAAKEHQVARQVELNLELKRVQRQRSDAMGKL